MDIELKKALKFVSLLIIILLILLFLDKQSWRLSKKIHNTKKQKNTSLHNKESEILTYGYMMFYSIIAGILIFFGLGSLRITLNKIFKHEDISNLVSVSIVVTFCFIYAALFRKILEEITESKIIISGKSNVIGYVLGRIIIIIGIYIYTRKLKL